VEDVALAMAKLALAGHVDEVATTIEGNWRTSDLEHRGFQEGIGMATSDFKKVLDSTRELEITVTGRKSGRKISTPVWFVHEGDVLYLLPVKGSDTHWYKNVVRTPTMDLAGEGNKVTVKPKRITDSNKVKEVVEQFRAKYGAGDVKKYYSKFDVGLEISLKE
jgi:hypothetical protein